MPRVIINDNKGLYQTGGSGIHIGSKGAMGTVSSAAVSLIATGANTEDISVAVPANALIVDVGVIVTTAIALNAGADITVAVGVGSAGNVDLSASANLASNVTAVPINTAFATSQANEATGLLALKVTAPVYRTASTDVFFRVGNSGNNVTAGEVKVFVRYLIA